MSTPNVRSCCTNLQTSDRLAPISWASLVPLITTVGKLISTRMMRPRRTSVSSGVWCLPRPSFLPRPSRIGGVRFMPELSANRSQSTNADVVCKPLHLDSAADASRILRSNIEGLFMRQVCMIAVLAMYVGSTAHADSIPAYNMTQGSVVLSNVSSAGFDTVFSFSNGNGTNIGGVDEGFSLGMSVVGGGQSGNPFLNIGSQAGILLCQLRAPLSRLRCRFSLQVVFYPAWVALARLEAVINPGPTIWVNSISMERERCR